MDSTALLTVVGVAVAVLFIFLIGLCLNCKGNSQPIYIRQQHDPRNSYAPSLPSDRNFTVMRTYTESHPFTVMPVQPPQHQLITSLPNARRTSACPSSDGGSQSDYINQNVDAVSYDQPPEKTPDYPDYLDVLPDDQNVSQQNLTSSLNSGQSYQNIKNDDNNDNDDDDSDSQQYINVSEDQQPATETPVGSFGSFSSDDQGSSEYVNAPHAHRSRSRSPSGNFHLV